MNKKIIIIVAALILLIGGVSYFFLSKQSSPKEQENENQFQDEVIPEISVSELGLTTEIRDDNKAIKFEIANGNDIELVDYQISYNKEVDGEEVPEGLIGTAKAENGKVGIKYREFGTCSSGKCRYDNVVSAIKLTLKITKTNGKIYQAETTVEVPGISSSSSTSKNADRAGGDF